LNDTWYWRRTESLLDTGYLSLLAYCYLANLTVCKTFSLSALPRGRAPVQSGCKLSYLQIPTGGRHILNQCHLPNRGACPFERQVPQMVYCQKTTFDGADCGFSLVDCGDSASAPKFTQVDWQVSYSAYTIASSPAWCNYPVI
jgi:hypothetical protein